MQSTVYPAQPNTSGLDKEFYETQLLAKLADHQRNNIDAGVAEGAVSTYSFI